MIDKLESFIEGSPKEMIKSIDKIEQPDNIIKHSNIHDKKQSNAKIFEDIRKQISLHKSKSTNSLIGNYNTKVDINKKCHSIETLVKNHDLKQENILLDLNLLKTKDDQLKIQSARISNEDTSTIRDTYTPNTYIEDDDVLN